MGLAKKLVEGTLGALSVGFDVVRHVAWLVTYHVNHNARESEED